MPNDATQYLHYFDDLDLPADQKIEVIESLLHILQVIVDWCWSGSSAENPLWINSDHHSTADSPAIESQGLIQTFNKAAAGSAGA